LQEAGAFLSKADPPPSEEGHAWFTSTVHALDHASHLAEAVEAMARTGVATDGPEEARAGSLCAESMRDAAGAAARLAISAGPAHAADDALANKTASAPEKKSGDARAGPSDDATEKLERSAKALADLRVAHRQATLDMVASGKLSASQAIARVDAVALMSRLAHHAWRAIAHLERAAAPRMELQQ
jgi:phosphate:Na+ symporter